MDWRLLISSSALLGALPILILIGLCNIRLPIKHTFRLKGCNGSPIYLLGSATFLVATLISAGTRPDDPVPKFWYWLNGLCFAAFLLTDPAAFLGVIIEAIRSRRNRT